MKINYIACLQKEINNRVYSLILPENAPFEEANEICLEFAQGILHIKKEREEMIEKAKLEQEMNDAREEAQSA